MNLPLAVFTCLSLFQLSPFIASAQLQTDFGKWNSFPRISYASKKSLYQRPLYRYNYELGKKFSRPRVQNTVKGERNGPWIQRVPDRTRYQTPFYDSNYKVKQALSSPRLQNGIRNGPYVSLSPYAPTATRSQRPFYDSNHLSKQTFLASRFQNGIGNGRYAPSKTNNYLKPFYNSNSNINRVFSRIQSSGASRFPYDPKMHQRSFSAPRPQNGNNPWIQYTPGTNSYLGKSFISNQKGKNKFSVPRQQNFIGIRSNAPWSMKQPKIAHYQKPSYFLNHNEDTAYTPNTAPKMRNGVSNTPYRGGNQPQMYKWLNDKHYSQNPYTRERKKSYIAALSSPGSMAHILPSSYQLPRYAIERKLDPVPSQRYGDVYTTGDVSLESVFSQLGQSRDRLIPESVSNQQATSRTGGIIAYEMEKEQRPAPRKSYVATSFTAKQGQLNDPQLKKLRHALQFLKKRSANHVNTAEKTRFVYPALHSGAIRQKERRSTSGTENHNTDKRNSENAIEKKSSIRKVKGKLNWGLLNDISPNVRLVSMILLKQKRENIRKRAVNDHSKTPEKSPEKEKPTAEKRVKQSVERAAQNRLRQSMPAKKQSKSDVSLSFVRNAKSFDNDSVPFKRKRTNNQSIPNRKTRKNARNFIHERSNHGFYSYPAKRYRGGKFSPFYEQRYMMPFVNSREQFEAAQMEIKKRMRAMRSRGLFQSLVNINPQFFSRQPLRYPLMPMSQFDWMQENGFPARNVPFQFRLPFPQARNYFVPLWNTRFGYGMREPQEFNFEPRSQERGGNLDTTSQGSYVEQEANQPTIDENNFHRPAIPSQANYDKLPENVQSPFTGQSSPILKIETNKVYEGLPIENTETNYDRSQGVPGNMNPQLQGMQAKYQSSPMLNKWFPIRTRKISFMADPRKVSSQWPSNLPGLDPALRLNILQSKGYFPAMYGPTFSRFYQDTTEGFQPEVDREKSSNAFAADGTNIENEPGAFHRGYQIPFPAYSMEGMNTISGEDNVQYPGKKNWYLNAPRNFMPNNVKRQILQKRDVIHRVKNFSKVPNDKEHLVDDNAIDQALNGGNNRRNPLENQSFLMSNVKKIEKEQKHSNETRKHSLTKLKKRARFIRNFVNMGNYFVNPRMVPNVLSFTPLSAPADLGIQTSDPREQFMANQMQMEDPIYAIKRKGYSVNNVLSGLEDVSKRWPFRPEDTFTQVQEFAFPNVPPQSVTELSQNFGQFPAMAFFSRQEDAQRQEPYTESMPTLQSNINEQSKEPQPREFQPIDVPSQQPLAFSTPQPSSSFQTPRDYLTEETITEQNEPESITSSLRYTPEQNDFIQHVQNPPDGDVAAFSEQNAQELIEGGTQSIPENGHREITAGNRRDLANGGEEYPQEDDSVEDVAHDVPGESDLSFTPGLLDGLDNSQASLLSQHIGMLAAARDGLANGPLSENPLQFSQRQKNRLQQNAIARQKALFQQRSIFSGNKGTGNIKGGTTSPNGHRLRLPNLSLNAIEKMIRSAAAGGTKAVYNTGAIHSYGSNTKGSVDKTVDFSDQAAQNGRYLNNFDWKSPLMSQSPNDFNSKLEKTLSQWERPASSNQNAANSGEKSLDSSPSSVFVPPTGASAKPDIVPGFAFDTQGQRSGPLFLPNPPVGLENDSNVETVLMVPPQVHKLEGQSGTKKGTINRKEMQKKNNSKS